MKHFLFLILSAALLSSCGGKATRILKDVRANLDTIQSASHQSVVKSWDPFQSEENQPLWSRETIEQRDLSEPYSGCKYIEWSEGDIIMCYDGQRRMRTNSKDLTYEIDSLFKGITEYRLVGVPFYQACRRIVDYALNTHDDIELKWGENDTIYLVDLKIHCKTQVELTMARPDPHLDEESNRYLEDPTSHYQLLIDKQTMLPIRYNRYMGHNNSYEEIVGTPVFNRNLDEPINCYKLIPEGYVNIDEGQNVVNRRFNPQKLIGTKTIDFTLSDDEGKPVKLSSFRGKTVLLMFTGIGCGPCKAAIPFMNELVKEQDPSRFQLLALECWKNNLQNLADYSQHYGLKYPLLLNGADIQSSYNLNGSVPHFFIINPDGIITAHFHGWSDSVGENISKVLNQ